MARRWTPQRTVILRRIRVACCSVAIVLASVCTFAVGARKTVALSINGQTTTVTTYASSVDRLLDEQGITIKSHDLIESTSKGSLKDHDVITIRSAYETTINIDGTEVPFWTVATSMDQLLGFFEQNEQAASKVTVDIKNVYNQLTGGLVINESGPVTVIADGVTSIAPNGKLTAASILDSKGITLGKEDRVSVERDNGTTILRVQRVKHQTETRTETIPFDTQTVVDNSLQPGQTVVQQAGQNGTKVDTYDVTYVDGVKESETLTSSQTTAAPVMQIIAVGPEQSSDSNDSDGSDSSSSGSAAQGDTDSDDSASSSSSSSSSSPSASASSSPSSSASASPKPAPSKTATATPSPSKTTTTPKPAPSQTATSKPSPSPSNTASTGGSSGSSSSGSGSSSAAGSRLWHPTVQQAQTYAAGAAAQRGWTGDEWTCLLNLWTKESGWRWSAGNPTSGAYGIPQSLPGSKMSQFGANWKDDGAVQIDWGLYYITIRYGKPSVAWQHWKDYNWY
ncbi:G5 domain-containing protein [Bifidobacterium apri]|uniref:aggregation-promoting factor C-terminal-like domain-containing protein n=1 Tax=Bifidobacterium apri TaxID=1769423 RepID=UPI0039941E0C